MINLTLKELHLILNTCADSRYHGHPAISAELKVLQEKFEAEIKEREEKLNND